MGKIAAVALLPAFLVGGAVMNSSVLLVDVQEPDAPHMVIPVPLSVVRAGLAFAPDEARRVRAPELAEHLPRLARLVDELRGAPDAVLVRVDDRDEHVDVSKEGDALRVRVVDGEHTAAKIDLPLRSVKALLEAYDAEDRAFRTPDLVSALRTVPRGEVLRVLDGETEVQVRMW